MDANKIDLNKPAFGDGAQKVSELSVEQPELKPEPVAEPVEKEKEVVESVEETKVPYSRFKKFHDEALQLRQEAADWRAKAEAIKPSAEVESNVPDYWKELYGESDQSLRAWKIQQEANERMMEAAQQKALEAVRKERIQEEQQVQQNLATLDDHLELVSAAAGRDLTDKEESAVLDIIDEFTPKGEDGSYLGAMLPADKAWEIYELKTQASQGPKKQSRDAVASLSGSQGQGDPSSSVERDKSFNPLNWNAYKDRL